MRLVRLSAVEAINISKQIGENIVRFKHTDGNDSDFISLCHKLDDFLNELAGGEENRLQYIPLNSLQDIHDVMIAYHDDVPVGCASFKRFENDTAEVKRVFVKDNYRGQGISKELMRLLENSAKEKGYAKLILETGEALTAAMGLYRAIGYQVIPNYGAYQCMKDSVCMSKNLHD
jgi:GNAT superfamily N-acetyltransferase